MLARAPETDTYSSLDDAQMLKGSIRRPKQPPAEADAKSSVELVNLFK